MDGVVPAHAHPLYAEGYHRIQGSAARVCEVETDTWRLVDDQNDYLGHAIRYEGRASLALELWEGDAVEPGGYAVDLEKSVLDLSAAAFVLRRDRAIRRRAAMKLVESAEEIC